MLHIIMLHILCISTYSMCFICKNEERTIPSRLKIQDYLSSHNFLSFYIHKISFTIRTKLIDKIQVFQALQLSFDITINDFKKYFLLNAYRRKRGENRTKQKKIIKIPKFHHKEIKTLCKIDLIFFQIQTVQCTHKIGIILYILIVLYPDCSPFIL